MQMLPRHALALLLRENAQTLGEYSLIITFVAILVIITSVIAFRDGLLSAYQSAMEQLGP